MAAVPGSQRICRIKVGNEEHTVSALSLHWLEVRPQGNVVGKAWRQEDHHGERNKVLLHCLGFIVRKFLGRSWCFVGG